MAREEMQDGHRKDRKNVNQNQTGCRRAGFVFAYIME